MQDSCVHQNTQVLLGNTFGLPTILSKCARMCMCYCCIHTEGFYCIKLFLQTTKNSYFITDRVRKKYCYLCEDLVPKLYWTNGSHRLSCQRQRLHKQFLDNLPTPYASITCPDCSEVMISNILHIIVIYQKYMRNACLKPFSKICAQIEASFSVTKIEIYVQF